MENKSDIYYNEFFEGIPNLSKKDRDIWRKENDRKKKTFAEHPTVNNLTRRDVWEDRAKFYFLPFFMNCYRFTRQNRLPHFAIPVSPTCMFYRDRLHLRNFMDTIWSAFFKCLDMCVPRTEPIMLLVEKRFHISDPIDGGTQQLYNMLWDYDLSALVKGNRICEPSKVILPPRNSESMTSRLAAPEAPDLSTYWDKTDLNPAVPEDGVELCRRTCWLMDDMDFLCRRYVMSQVETPYPEIIDTSKYPQGKQELYANTARTFYFKMFTPKYVDEDVELVSSDSELDDIDSTEFDFDETQLRELDSTLDFVEDDKEMNKIIAFFAKMPKVTGLVQGMIDMLNALTRILPLVIVKIDDEKLKDSLNKTINMLNLGLGKVLKICAYLGIKVERKQSGAVGEIVKNRFKKDKKDFLEYEIDELNKSLDALENVDEEPPKPPKGQIPIDVKPNHLYPQRMPLGPKPPPPIVVPPEPPPVPVKPEPPKPPAPPPKPASDKSELAKPEPPPIPSVMPEPPNHPPKNENGIK